MVGKTSVRGRYTACLLFTALGASALPAAAQESKAPWVLDAFAGAAKDSADETGAAPVMPTLERFSTSLGERLAGPANAPYRSEFKGGLNDQDQPWLNSRAFVPFAQSNVDTMLFQGNVTHTWTGEPEAEPSGGLGLGYRRLFGEGKWLAGANAFMDDGWSGDSARGSFGGELRTAPINVTMNYYTPYSTGTAAEWQPSAASGYDYDLRLKIPYIPSATVSVGGGSWAFEPTLGLMESKRLGVSFAPLPYLALDGRMDRSADMPAAYSLGLRFTLPLDGKPRAVSQGVFDDHMFQSSSVAERSLDIIQRDEAPHYGFDGG